jgi:hypothetical protein
MSLEHSPTRQRRRTGGLAASPPQGESLAGDLMLGAGPIAFFLYGEDTDETRRDVYRNPMGLSFFRHGALLAALKSTLRAEIAAAQKSASEKTQTERQKKLNKETARAPLPKRNRRWREATTEA